MKKVAILIDGGFLSAVYHTKTSNSLHEDKIIPICNDIIKDTEEIFRIYYYDSPPFGGKVSNPISKKITDYSQTGMYRAVSIFHRKLAQKDLIAFRKGTLSCSGWKLTREVMDKLKEGEEIRLKPEDLKLDLKQKIVDIKIGLDIAWISSKKIVDKIILITEDNDFIPAMKLARREGLHITVVEIGDHLSADMKMHSDETLKLDITKY